MPLTQYCVGTPSSLNTNCKMWSVVLVAVKIDLSPLHCAFKSWQFHVKDVIRTGAQEDETCRFIGAAKSTLLLLYGLLPLLRAV